MKKRLLTILIAIIICLQLFVIGWLCWINHSLKTDVYAMSIYAGTLQACVDYEKGKLRIYELVIDGPTQYTGNDEGKFEIWNWGYYHKSFYYSNKSFVDSYNRKIQILYQKTENGETIEPEPMHGQ